MKSIRVRVISILLIALMMMAFMPINTGISYADDTCEVTFDSNGGTDIAPQTVTKGEKAVKPEDPKNNSGIRFIGWFVNPTIDNVFDEETMGLNTFNFDTPITEDITLTGLWSAQLTVNTEGFGRIDVVDEGETPELDDEYPFQSNVTNCMIGIWDTFVIGAKADEGYVFKEWLNTDTGNTYSTESIFTLKLDKPLNIVAVFEPIDGAEDEEEITPTDAEDEKPDTSESEESVKEDPPKEAKDVPKTGDDNNMLIWVVIALVAVLGVAIAIRIKNSIRR